MHLLKIQTVTPVTLQTGVLPLPKLLLKASNEESSIPCQEMHGFILLAVS